MFERSLNSDIDQADTLHEIAVKLVEGQLRLLKEQSAGGPKERTLFVLGSSGVGKSTVLHRFFDQKENTRPTLALEYSYGRRIGPTVSQQLAQKQVLNVWELGSLVNAQQLIEVPLRKQCVEQLAVIIMLDLGQPQRIWLDLECAYQGLKDACEKLLTADQWVASRIRMAERLKRKVVDAESLYLLPFPLIIVGGKYDIFMDFEPEMKKHVCRCLRSMAHLVGGALLFYSSQMPKLAKTLRDTISHLGFGSPSNPFRTHNIDYNEALSVWFGADKWENIDADVFVAGMNPVERIGVLFSMKVSPLESTHEQVALANPTKDGSFRESGIDGTRAQMDNELHSLVHVSHQRGKFEAVGIVGS